MLYDKKKIHWCFVFTQSVYLSTLLHSICSTCESKYYVMNMCCHISFFQLQSRFEQLKRLHAEEKAALEEKKRLLDDDLSSFGKRKAAAQLLQAQSLTANGKKDKDRKK